MADGKVKPIQQIKAGDKVLSRDEKSGETKAKKVVQTFERQVSATLVLHFKGGERIETTDNHPFYVEGKGFVKAGELGIGTSIVTRAGPSAELVKVERKNAPATVYNFEVADFHTYFVGSHDGGLWVHNDCIVGKGTLADDMEGSGFRPGQFGVSAPKINKLIDAMETGEFNWNAMDEPILVDGNGVITSGHHRIIAAILSETPIPEGIIQRGTTYIGRVIEWSDVWVLPV